MLGWYFSLFLHLSGLSPPPPQVIFFPILTLLVVAPGSDDEDGGVAAIDESQATENIKVYSKSGSYKVSFPPSLTPPFRVFQSSSSLPEHPDQPVYQCRPSHCHHPQEAQLAR